MRRVVAAGVLLVAVLGGCAAPVSGTPVPAPSGPASSDPAPSDPASPGPGTSAPPGPTVDLPPRPRDVPVDGVDPCTLLTAADRAELGLDFEPLLDVNPSRLYNGGVTQLCSIRSSERGIGSVGVELSVTGGIEVFLQPGVQATITPTEVAGFPAVVVDPTRFTEFCNVAVDVAPQQVVDVDISNAGNSPPIPEGELCRESERVAGIVMSNLLAR